MAQTSASSERQAAVPLLETKLRRPTGSHLQVARPRLLDRLAASGGLGIILVSAPAGYGKSALISGWLAAGSTPYAWLSLDEHDDDLAAFLVYLVAAVRTAWPQGLDDFARLLNTPTVLPPYRLADALIQGLLALDGTLILALDDYHTITAPEIHALMVRVVEHLPPNVQLVLMTRADPPLPLPRLRAGGRVDEIRAADLRFSPEESRQLLQLLLGPELSPETVAETAALLEDGTEGWAVGLQLAALSLRGRPDPPAFARKIAQHGHQAISEYLLAEVLGGLPPTQRAVLLHSSLFDRFCAPLLDAVEAGSEQATGGERLDGESFVRAVRRANLFVVALDEEGTWFRYHHFFQSLLRTRLAQDCSPEDIKAIHARAWRWFGAQGLTSEAVIHALAGGDAPAAAGLVEAQVHAALNREDWRGLDRLLGLLPPEVFGRPRLIIAHAWVNFFRWQFGALAARIDAVERALDTAPDTDLDPARDAEAELRGEIALLRAAHASGQGGSAETAQFAEAALPALGPDRRFALGMAQFYYSWGLQACGHYARAVAFAQEQLELYGGQADAVTLRLYLAQATAHFEMANLPAMERVATVWYKLAAPTSFGLSLGWALFGLGWLHYQKNELDAAQEYFGRLAAMAWAANGRAAVDGYTGLVLIALARGRPAEAQAHIDALHAHLLERGMSAETSVVHSLEQRVALAGGTPAALAWRRARHPSPAGGEFWDQPDLTEVRTLLAAAAGPDAPELAEAAALLAKSRALAEARSSTRRLIEIGGLQALLLAARGEAAGARAALAEAVLLAARGGALRLLLDSGPTLVPLLHDLQSEGLAPAYIQSLLAAFGAPLAEMSRGRHVNASVRPSPELFTNRELDVLSLLALRLGDKEIAARLVLSPLTVKKHTQRLYRKLGVANRRAAVAEARRLGLI